MKCANSTALILVCVTLLLGGCAPKPELSPLPEQADLAVAGFALPVNSRELFPESPPPSLKTIDPEILASLDQALESELSGRGRAEYRGLALVRQCREIVLEEHPEEKLPALRYWTLVGRCIPADYLLVPQLFEWQEREGGEWGVEEPARVVFDFYLLDVDKEQILNRFHFEQEQQSLAENLLTISMFWKRGGKWISARDLAREGIVQGVKELGL